MRDFCLDAFAWSLLVGYVGVKLWLCFYLYGVLSVAFN